MSDQTAAAERQIRDALASDRIAAGTRPLLELLATRVRIELAATEVQREQTQALARIADRLDELLEVLRTALAVDRIEPDPAVYGDTRRI
jgi:hypothetical protein